MRVGARSSRSLLHAHPPFKRGPVYQGSARFQSTLIHAEWRIDRKTLNRTLLPESSGFSPGGSRQVVNLGSARRIPCALTTDLIAAVTMASFRAEAGLSRDDGG